MHDGRHFVQYCRRARHPPPPPPQKIPHHHAKEGSESRASGKRRRRRRPRRRRRRRSRARQARPGRGGSSPSVVVPRCGCRRRQPIPPRDRAKAVSLASHSMTPSNRRCRLIPECRRVRAARPAPPRTRAAPCPGGREGQREVRASRCPPGGVGHGAPLKPAGVSVAAFRQSGLLLPGRFSSPLPHTQASFFLFHTPLTYPPHALTRFPLPAIHGHPPPSPSPPVTLPPAHRVPGLAPGQAWRERRTRWAGAVTLTAACLDELRPGTR